MNTRRPNVTAVPKHVDVLRRKGLLATTDGKTRSIVLRSPLQELRHRIVHIPLFGSIPAGPPGDRDQDAEGCVSVDIESVGIRPTSRTFALRISGDSMIGKHIVDGDVVVIEHGKEPRPGDVWRRSPRAEHLENVPGPAVSSVLRRGPCPDPIPAAELVIQGVVAIHKWS